MTAHALLSPSSSHRWLNCTAAPRLEEGIEDEGSDFAAEGTLAHAFCAQKLKYFLGLPTDAEVLEIADFYADYHSGEMDEYTDAYVAIVLAKFNEAKERVSDAQLLVETRLSFENYIADAFGTADAIIIADGTMEVIDFKYGKGVKVSAVDNPQMMIYALGAYDKFSFDYNIERVKMTIVQPRIDNLSEDERSVKDLLTWATDTLTPKAREAYAGNGPQVPGSWCQFCKVKSQCRALVNRCQEVSKIDPKLISAEELARDVLPILPTVKTWLAGVEDYALAQALSGVVLPGYKVVEGRSMRKIIDVANAERALITAGYELDEVRKPAELRSITELEKLTGKKLFAELCGAYIDKPTGKPTLVPESDKRQAISPSDDFAGINI